MVSGQQMVRSGEMGKVPGDMKRGLAMDKTNANPYTAEAT